MAIRMKKPWLKVTPGGSSSGSPAALGFPSSSRIGAARVSPDQDATSDSQDGTYDLINPLVLEALRSRISESLFDDVVAAAEAHDVAALARLLGEIMVQLSSGGGDSGKAIVAEHLRKSMTELSTIAVLRARLAPLTPDEHELSKRDDVRAVEEARGIGRVLTREGSIHALAKAGR